MKKQAASLADDVGLPHRGKLNDFFCARLSLKSGLSALLEPRIENEHHGRKDRKQHDGHELKAKTRYMP